jgi:hypothetical protein
VPESFFSLLHDDAGRVHLDQVLQAGPKHATLQREK